MALSRIAGTVEYGTGCTFADIAIDTLIPAGAASLGIMSPSYVTQMQINVAAHTEPWYSAWTSHLANNVGWRMEGSADVFAGPTVNTQNLVDALTNQLVGNALAARDCAIAYAVTGTTSYATKTRSLLLAWAQGNTPSVYAGCADGSLGTYIGPGYFSMAYGYDLTKDSGVYSAGDKSTILAWFRAACDAEYTFLTYWDTVTAEWDTTEKTYQEDNGSPAGHWGTTLHHVVKSWFMGHDSAQMPMMGVLSMAIMCDYGSMVTQLFNPSLLLNVPAVIHHATAGNQNDGDGVSGHPVPVPNAAVYMQSSADNGDGAGNIDYQSYVTRMSTMLVQLGEASGHNMTTPRSDVQASWDYLHYFYGTGPPEGSFVPNDVVDVPMGRGRFVLGYRLFPSDTLIEDACTAGTEADYYEVQYAGPTTLTHWPLGG